jgi:hypothetical protein
MAAFRHRQRLWHFASPVASADLQWRGVSAVQGWLPISRHPGSQGRSRLPYSDCLSEYQKRNESFLVAEHLDGPIATGGMPGDIPYLVNRNVRELETAWPSSYGHYMATYHPRPRHVPGFRVGLFVFAFCSLSSAQELTISVGRCNCCPVFFRSRWRISFPCFHHAAGVSM